MTSPDSPLDDVPLGDQAYGARHGRPVAARRFVRPVAVGVATLLLVTVSAAAAFVTANRPKSVDVKGLVHQGPDQPTRPPAGPDGGRAVNILLLGSDSRMGEENQRLGGTVAGMRSDTTIVLHVSADRSRVELVSIPRDSLVDIPECKTTKGKAIPAARNTMINAAFARGWDSGGDLASAAACAWNTVEATTGLYIDHFALVDFAGFEQMVNAVGGVDIYVDRAMRQYDGDGGGLNLSAGHNHLDGEQALYFARARYVTGTDGSDITRITHQQQLLRALAEKVMASSSMSDVASLTRLVNAVSSNLTVDQGLSVTTSTSLAYSLRSVSRSNVVFATAPFQYDTADPNRVRLTDQADEVWAAMASDTPIADVLPKDAQR
ncbi:MAG: LCP family protein [Micrococcales bacterium]|nr:LCP family protein [Micrococcales bacterium]